MRPSLAVQILAVLMILATLSTVPTRAVDGRDFAGFYEISNVADLGDTVRLTLTIRAFNYSDADVANATLSLYSGLNSAEEFGAYPGTYSIANRDSVRISADFTIPKAEFDRWQAGDPPGLRLDYRDAENKDQRRTAELMSMPVGE